VTTPLASDRERRAEFPASDSETAPPASARRAERPTSVSETVPVASDDAAERLCLDRRASERALCSLVKMEDRA
jgi:hypothetical protein